jgi:hypothetical protein
LHGLVAGKTKSTLLLDKDGPLEQERGQDQPTPISPLASSADPLFAVVGNRLYRYRLEDHSGESPELPYFEPTQSAFVIPAEGETVLRHRVLEGKAPFTYTLAENYNGALRIDSGTGEVHADGVKLLRQATIGAFGIDPENPGQTTAAAQGVFPNSKRIADNQNVIIPAFEVMAGRKPNGIPVAVPVALSARDANGVTAALSYVVAVEVAQDLIDKFIEAQTKATAASTAKGSGTDQDSQQAILSRLAAIEPSQRQALAWLWIISGCLKTGYCS